MADNFTDWRKPSLSFSNGNCVEVGIKAWRKSARSAANGACVEVGRGTAVVGVRDTKLADSPVLAFPAASWGRFLVEVRRGG